MYWIRKFSINPWHAELFLRKHKDIFVFFIIILNYCFLLPSVIYGIIPIYTATWSVWFKHNSLLSFSYNAFACANFHWIISNETPRTVSVAVSHVLYEGKIAFYFLWDLRLMPWWPEDNLHAFFISFNQVDSLGTMLKQTNVSCTLSGSGWYQRCPFSILSQLD